MRIDVPVLFIGDEKHPEFAPIAACLASQGAKIESCIAGAVATMEGGFTPAIIVVAQPWPGHISLKQINLLREAAPLARVVSLLGTWLEGEARSGKPWPAVWRTYWHNWLPRFAVEFDRLAAGQETLWSLSPTAGDDERLGARCRRDTRAALMGKTIAVISTNRETAEALGDVCRDRGWRWVWLKLPSDEFSAAIDLAVFDSRNLQASEFSQISDFRSQLQAAPLIVLAGFPRPAEVEQLKALGVAAVVSKPFLNHELTWQIEQLLSRASHAA